MRWANVLHLGVKELRALARDPVMLGLILWAFSLAIQASSASAPDTVNRAPIAVVDEDRSPLSQRILAAFGPPLFTPPEEIAREEIDARLDAGRDTFVLTIPPAFQRDALAGRAPAMQLNVDATQVAQAFSGAGYAQSIAVEEARRFLAHGAAAPRPAVPLTLRARFNPSLDQVRFAAIMQLINNVTILTIVLTGAALIREREHGTVEHLLAMPVRPVEIMLSKTLAMGLVVLCAVTASLFGMIGGVMGVETAGNPLVFLAGAALHVFAAGAMGVLLGVSARSMPQFGLLVVMTILPLQMLSGGMTPFESMPPVIQGIMQAAPTTHFVALAQAVLYRGAGIEAVWPQMLALAGLGAVLFLLALRRFRASMAAGG